MEVTAALGRLRGADVQKPPGIAEGIDWVAALELLGPSPLQGEPASQAADLHNGRGALGRRSR